MPFDFNVWKSAVLRTVDETTNTLDLLVATGLVEADDTLEEAFERLLMSLQAESVEEPRRTEHGPEGNRHG